MATVENHLIELLPHKDRRRLLALCEPIQLSLAEVLCEPGEPTRHVYFPIEGFISLVARTDCHPGLEVGMVGREGMLGAHLGPGRGHCALARAGARPRSRMAHDHR